MGDIFQTDRYIINKDPDVPQSGGGALDIYEDSTNDIADADKIVTREDADGTWYKKTFSKVWNYIKGKIGIASATNSYLRNDGTWTTELTPTKIANTAVSDFTSGDSTDANATAWTSVTKVDNNTAFGTFFSRVSTMMKNVRFLYKLLGTTNISAIGGGTVTGAISALNTSLAKCKTVECILYRATPTTANTFQSFNLVSGKKYSDYAFIIIAFHFYGNTLLTSVEPTALFLTHNSSGNRLIMLYSTAPSAEIYCSSGTNAVIKLTSITNYSISIYGMIKV